MSIQSALIYIFFAVAVAYIGRRIYRALRHKEGDAGCEHCASSGLSEIKKIPEK
jgi:hypothetical protein